MNTLLDGLWDRSLDHYPTHALRIWYLALAIIATITLYYEAFTLASVARHQPFSAHLLCRQELLCHYLSTSFKFPLAQANRVVSVFFVIIVISSMMRVRKPLLLIGTISLGIVTLLFISRTGQPTSSALMTVLLALIGICISITFVPWVAAYTETVEDINPALVATGIAVEVFISRCVAVIAILALPVVVGNGQGWGMWWWFCIAGQVIFLPTILTTSGQWNPARARATAQARERAEILEAQSNIG